MMRCNSINCFILLLFYLVSSAFASSTAEKSRQNCSNSRFLPCEVIDISSSDYDYLSTPLSADSDIEADKNASSIGDASPTIDWGRLRPQGLRTFVLYKTDPSSLGLTFHSSVRWRLPLTAHAELPQSIEGFIVRIESRQSNTTLTSTSALLQISKIYIARLERPVASLTLNHSSVEFFVDVNELFEFDETYSIEISFYPEDTNGSGRSTLMKEIAKRPSNSNACDQESKDIAKFWTPSFSSLIAHEFTADVEVSFLPAPKSLCVSHYSLYIQSPLNDKVLGYVLVNATGDEFRLRHVFKTMPREERLIIKLLAAAAPNDGPCVCTHCHCITVTSNEFKIPALTYKEFTQPTLPSITNRISSNNGHLVFFSLLMIFCILLAFFALILIINLLLWKNRSLKKSINILSLSDQNPILDFRENNKSYKYLLLASPVSSNDAITICALANLIRNSNHTLLYNKFDEDQFEQNIYSWYKAAISLADKILIVHCQSKDSQKLHSFRQLDIINDYSIAYGNISLLDDRVIHINLCPSLPILYSEIVYNIPRDIVALCSVLEIPINNDWLQLEELTLESSKIPKAFPSSQQFCQIERIDETEQDQVVVEERPGQISASLTLDSGIYSFNNLNASCDSIVEMEDREFDQQSRQFDSGIQEDESQDFSNIIKNSKLKSLDNKNEKPQNSNTEAFPLIHETT